MKINNLPDAAVPAAPAAAPRSYGVTYRCPSCLERRATAGRKRLRLMGLPQWVCHACVAVRFPPAAA